MARSLRKRNKSTLRKKRVPKQKLSRKKYSSLRKSVKKQRRKYRKRTPKKTRKVLRGGVDEDPSETNDPKIKKPASEESKGDNPQAVTESETPVGSTDSPLEVSPASKGDTPAPTQAVTESEGDNPQDVT